MKINLLWIRVDWIKVCISIDTFYPFSFSVVKRRFCASWMANGAEELNKNF
ncbi:MULTISPECIES: hypothetical protein [unclassified Bacillus (in: firmicutes)]|uniref:hypothetical protein n=1 Tax=unclassified Bacillus (in: firmicutes) TaxID=185979 RepID=UPI0015871E27|nr:MULTISPECIES: hypothetical protein [unclassified Bacillus (in: firmicutes)]